MNAHAGMNDTAPLNARVSAGSARENATTMSSSTVQS
jgi:hypothetical protein